MPDTIPFQDSPAFYRSLFDNMLDGLAYGQIIFDKQGHAIDYKYIRVNKHFEELTGLKDVEGKRATEILPIITTSNPDWIETHYRVASTGRSERFDIHIAPLGKWFLISIYSAEKDSFVSVFQNITDRKRAEKDLEKFKLALDNISDNVIITDPEGIVVYANNAVEKVTGYTPAEAIGKKSGELWKSPMPTAFYQTMWDTIKRQKNVFIGELQNKRKNGEIYTAMISISPILDKNDAVEFFVSIERDITEQKRVDRAKSEFMTLASHQLRTPPSIISWYTETLQSGDLGTVNEKQGKYLAEISRANQRMIEIINSLLNISRIEMGTFAISSKEVDIREMVEETIKELTSRFGRTAEIVKNYDNALHPIFTDPNIIEIVIENLLSNSFKYSPPADTKIVITVKEEDGALFLSVKDNGIGILSEDQDKVFQRLFRADNAVAADPDGIGLGLYMTQKLVVGGLHGKIWFESEAKKGTTFFVSIPVVNMEEKAGTTHIVRTQ
jgi:PAS domain S-box-containing protein